MQKKRGSEEKEDFLEKQKIQTKVSLGSTQGISLSRIQGDLRDLKFKIKFMLRVGMGQDSHRFSEDKNKPLILGGVEFSGGSRFESNSDGDVIIHALCNALEQAIGGQSFSAYADEMCEKGIIDSKEYLKKTLKHIQNKGYQINNIGISVEAKRPKIDPKGREIKKVLAETMMIDEDLIGLTATSGESLTAFGRGEGIQAWAIVSLVTN